MREPASKLGSCVSRVPEMLVPRYPDAHLRLIPYGALRQHMLEVPQTPQPCGVSASLQAFLAVRR
jgi:hypothetical protein